LASKLSRPHLQVGFLVMNTHESIELAGQRLVKAVGSTDRVILFGSAARGELTRDSDLDFLVIEREVEDRITEAVRLRDAVGRVGRPVDVIVMEEELANRRAKVRGTMVHHALQEGQLIAPSDS
jgi:predicted nucleotidyltransferase